MCALSEERLPAPEPKPFLVGNSRYSAERVELREEGKSWNPHTSLLQIFLAKVIGSSPSESYMSSPSESYAGANTETTRGG